MDWKDLKNKNAEELKEILAESRSELQNLIFQARIGQLKQVHKAKQVRKTIARIETLLKSLGKK